MAGDRGYPLDNYNAMKWARLENSYADSLQGLLAVIVVLSFLEPCYDFIR